MRTRSIGPCTAEAGTTLTEMVVTLAIFSLILIGVLGAWTKAQEAYFVGSETAEVQQNVRAAIDFMVREIRAAGRDLTNCAFDYATSGTFTAADCTSAKAAACQLKVGGSYTAGGCQGIFAVPFGTVLGVTVPSATAIAIRSDRNDTGTIAGTANASGSDPGGENVLYTLVAPGSCPGVPGVACITRDDGSGPQAMVAVDISGLTIRYFPKPGFPPCNATPPQNPCPQFTPANQADADGIGRIQIEVTAQQVTGATTVSRTLITDVYLRNRS